MVRVCFYFQVHQPFRLDRYRVFDVGQHDNYFNGVKDREIMERVAKKCYMPANQLMLKLINKHAGKFKISYSISGVALDQFEMYAPEVIDTFRELAQTGCVEFLSETYYHSLSFLYSQEEFTAQVEKHKKRIQSLFGVTPTVFRNTELIYLNDIAPVLKEMGYKGVLAEGADHILQGRNPNFVYESYGNDTLPLLLKNYKLSDDIAFRFSNQGWKEHPLTVEKFSQWVGAVNGSGELVNLFMDYETFGEHQWAQTGIFRFLDRLPAELLKHPDNSFVTPAEALEECSPRDTFNAPYPVSWADLERDLSAWTGNLMQKEALRQLFSLESDVKAIDDPVLLEKWRKLSTSDHFYYMCTKWFADGDVHKYFNPYDSPYDCAIYFMNALSDLKKRIENRKLYNQGTAESAQSFEKEGSYGARISE